MSDTPRSQMKPNHGPLLCALLLFVANLFSVTAVYHWKAKHALLESQLDEYRLGTVDAQKLWFCRGALAGVFVWEQWIKHDTTNRPSVVCDLICEAAWEPYADIKATKASQ